MRTFFALDLAPKLKLDIAQWCNKALPNMDGKVATANYHITLCFNGKTSENQLQEMQSATDTLLMNQFDLKLDDFGYFTKPKICFIGCREIPSQLHQLNQKLEQIAQQAGFRLEKRPYVPHVTLFRRLLMPPPMPLLSPNFAMRAESFSLYESMSQRNGVVYRPIFTWELERDYRPKAMQGG
ncbi:RNA 2',3'-cyclic phosphodiesterase [Paraneptunicella aestuarii]|uniref:RNA 2',3'-cyclic phosphodiesterase n=1 Tax=Paraneptunicella aestuarii TaxID=2831148 RepID=UPI001E621CBE|nr:RNA 2',3'-cyclic phosphodiesterase [Paraneptunicella aestuarii]UAA38275.1 RNA 2',3'-cyclic phosphodiesterase [Paraneptunicella aestuarii]